MNVENKKIYYFIFFVVFLFIIWFLFSNFFYHTSPNGIDGFDSLDDEGRFSDMNSPPSAEIYADVTKGESPLSVSFKGNGFDSDGRIVRYVWDFGDGKSSDEQNPTHIFESGGIYQVRLKVFDDEGTSGFDTISIHVEYNQAPEAHATYYTSRVFWDETAPAVVYFQGEGYDSDGDIVSYHWEFGPKYLTILPYVSFFSILRKGQTPFYLSNYESDEQNPIRIFFQPGYYWAKLTVTDDDGLSGFDSVDVFVYDVKTTIKNTFKAMFQRK